MATTKKKRRPRVPCMSADGQIIKRGTLVFSLFTRDGGETWHVEVFHNWQYRGKVMGDNRLYVSLTAALAEADRRDATTDHE